MYSKVMYGSPSCSPTSWTWTMFGWRIWATARASLRKRASCVGGGMVPRQDPFEGHDAVEVELTGEVDDPHSPSPELSQDFVTGQVEGMFDGEDGGAVGRFSPPRVDFGVGLDPQERGHRCDRLEPRREVGRYLRAVAAHVVHRGGLSLLPQGLPAPDRVVQGEVRLHGRPPGRAGAPCDSTYDRLSSPSFMTRCRRTSADSHQRRTVRTSTWNSSATWAWVQPW